jgi:CHAD domain-containing protein
MSHRGAGDFATRIMIQQKHLGNPGSRVVPDPAGDSPSPVGEVSPHFEPDDPAGKAVASALEAAISRVRASAPDARLGDKDGIHRLRTSIRRLRSELRAFKELIDSAWRKNMEGELKWLAGLLGAVRDQDILMERLRKEVSSPTRRHSSARALAPLFAAIEARRTQASSALDDGLEGDRYRRLLDSLKAAADHPLLLDEARFSCRDVLPSSAAAAWRRLKKVARGLRPSDPVVKFHELRKRAKRVRYTAELVEPIIRHGDARAARRFIRLTTRIQEVLGENQDALDATREIEEVLEGRRDDPPFVQAATELIEAQDKAARSARNDFFDVWDKLDRKKWRRWMKNQPRTEVKASASRESSLDHQGKPLGPSPSPGRRSLRHAGAILTRPHQ